MSEPKLDELLAEPIIRKVMLADGYSAEDIRLLLRQAGDRSRYVSHSPKHEFEGFAALGCSKSQTAGCLQAS